MRLSEVVYDGAKPIEGYGPGFFRIGGEVIEGPVLILPSGAGGWGGLEATDPLLAAAGDIDVLFLGTGIEISHAPASLRLALEGANIGLEVMATPPACRAYNVVLSEGRRIGAALLPV